MSTRTLSGDRRSAGGRFFSPVSAAGLPLHGRLTLAATLSLAVALLLAVASLAGLLFQETLYPTAGLRLSAVPIDLINLFAGLPLLLGSMWLARRGRLIGLLLWPGALFYVLYIYVFYVFAMPFNALFPAYVALLPLSAYGIIALLARIDGRAVQARLEGAVPARTIGGILLALGLFVVGWQIGQIFTALAAGTPLGLIERGVILEDLLIGGPGFLAGGLFLWRRRPLGYVTAAGLLLQCALLAFGLIPVMIYQARAQGTPVDGPGIAIVALMGLVCLVPLAYFARAAGRSAS